MSVSDFFALVHEVDPGWLELTIRGGYGLSLFAWSAALFLTGWVCHVLASRFRRKGGYATEGEKQKPVKPRPVPRPAVVTDSDRRAMIGGFSRLKAQAVLKAYGATSYIDVGDYRLEVFRSYQFGEGIFDIQPNSVNGVPALGPGFTLTPAWRAFLKKLRNLERLREAANGAPAD